MTGRITASIKPGAVHPLTPPGSDLLPPSLQQDLQPHLSVGRSQVLHDPTHTTGLGHDLHRRSPRSGPDLTHKRAHTTAPYGLLVPHHQIPSTAIPTKTHTRPPTTHQGVMSQVLPRAVARPVRPFRMSKHDLPARPVFHHTRDATWAHLTMVMAALAVARYLQNATGMSIARIVRELHNLQEAVININGHHINATPQLTPKAEEILTALSTPPQHTKRHKAGAMFAETAVTAAAV